MYASSGFSGSSGTLCAIAAIALVDLGPTGYPIALAATACHSVWLGGVLHGRLHAER
jgi:hypothetical protein